MLVTYWSLFFVLIFLKCLLCLENEVNFAGEQENQHSWLLLNL